MTLNNGVSLFFFVLEPSVYPENLIGSALNFDGLLNISWKVSPIMTSLPVFIALNFVEFEKTSQEVCKKTL